jgi:chromosome segregation ATPase
MMDEIPQQLIPFLAGAFLFGGLLTGFVLSIAGKKRASKHGARDHRIRELEAELRIARNTASKSESSKEQLELELKEATTGIERRDKVITDQLTKIDKIEVDLKDSVRKTRELREELSDRAAQSIRAEAKIREIETELSIVQTSTDMIASGVLDYGLSPKDADTRATSASEDKATDVRKTSS